MLFGHTYDIRIKAKLSDGSIAKCKMPVEARLVSKTELLDTVKSKFENEVKWKYDLSVIDYLEIYDAS